MSSSARIDELRKKFDENPRRFFAPLANEYRKAGDFEQAVFICQEYLPQQPGHMSGHIVYGQTLFDMGRDEEARAVFETALTLDPENLIALKHLGDIARQAGDIEAARSWYQRVLEADPRNDEIMQVLESIAGGGAGLAGARAAADVAPEAPPAAVADSSSDIPDYLAGVPPLPVSEADADSDELVLEQSVDAEMPVGGTEIVTMDAGPEVVPEPAPELLDVEDFSFGSSATSSHAPSETEPEAEPVAATDAIEIDDFVAEPVAAAETIDIDDFAAEPVVAAEVIDVVDFAAEPIVAADAIDVVDFADEPVVAAEAIDIDDFAAEPDVEIGSSSDEQVPEPSVELATDVILGLPDDSPTPVESPEVSGFEAEEAPVAGEDLTRAIDQLEGLETFSLDAPVETTAETSDEPVVADAPDTFATETMAELYAQQGHIESAMDIYGQLLERSPNDEELRRRASEVERQARDAGDEVAPPAEAVEEAPLVAGPTIRDFFRELLEARGVQGSFEETPAESVASLAGSTSYEPEGSLDILFSEVATDEADDSAAMSLAQAFGSGGETSDDAALQGTPAHPASDELSLDHVFRSATPAKGSGTATAFSLDQFFSSETANGELPKGSNENAQRSSDDIAQFNAWLNGLKKT